MIKTLRGGEFRSNHAPIGSKETQESATPARVPVLQEESDALLLSFLMPKRAGVAENTAAARPISCKIPEYLQEKGKSDA